MDPSQIDLDTFFKEQEERMNMSDSDWETYEERMRQERKRKRDERRQGKECDEDRLEPVLEESSNEIRPPKKTKMSHEEPRVSPVEAASDPITTSIIPANSVVSDPSSETRPPKKTKTSHEEPRVSLVEATNDTDIASTSTIAANNVVQDEISVSSSHRRGATGLSGRVRKTQPAASSSSNITTLITTSKYPEITEILSESEEALVPPKPKKTARSIISKTASASTSRNASAAKTAAQVKKEAAKSKKLKDDKEALMTPVQYAALLQEKWQNKVSNTPPEKLFLKDKVIFLIFEEKNKASKDTRAKLDIIAKNGGQVATKYDPEVVTHIIPGGGTINMRKTLRALGLKSLAEIPPEIHTVTWDWIVSGLSRGKLDSEVMHELYKDRMIYKLRGASSAGISDSKGKGKMKATDISFTNEHSVIEEFSVYDSPDESDVQSHPARSRVASTNSKSESKSNLKSNSLNGDDAEDPLLPFYAKAREEAQSTVRG
ncbi:hypothetical protein M422DRAFT_254933 [Sphaerobolus stellatus SS14]|uniref:BRCT domain-containing protein n=1 Tax=Sphaerobolus stellatus (strain SS14) TaxID=990650 RepID=A0A0C9VJZ6_SPHS4|nr:hypothetical protein M422DRAFT_254933 [Sphaerobolus stellatus SS14]